jgi:hypothetical protein
MTWNEGASVLRKLADAFEKVGGEMDMLRPKPHLEGDFAVGAIGHLQYLRDLFTGTEKEHFTRDEILVLLDLAGHDPEVFMTGAWELVEKCGEDE